MKNLVLYTFGYNRHLTSDLFNFLIDYFRNTLLVTFNYAGFYDETYDDKYGTFDSIKARISKGKWGNIVNFSLDKDDIRKKNCTTGAEFNISRPEILTIYYSEFSEFDVSDFIKKSFPFFNALYGFTYLTSEKYWFNSYAFGDWKHVKGIVDIERLSKYYMDQWQNGCEKIQEGYIRDVYNENILNEKHLQRTIDGVTLERLIISQEIGILYTINKSLSLWRLNSEQLKKARLCVYKSDLII